MCKKSGNSFCSELGAESSLWSGRAPLSKPDWILDGFQDLIDSLQFAFKGELSQAEAILKTEADMQMRVWFNVHAQNSGSWRSSYFGVARTESNFPKDPNKSFKKLEESIYERDGYRCRYCNSEVLPKWLFKRAFSILQNDVLPLGKTNATRSGFYLMFVATIDHVVPWSLGGRTEASNLVTCCWSCNYGKSNFTIQQIGIENPFQRIPELKVDSAVRLLLDN